jgi:hypothetical protein
MYHHSHAPPPSDRPPDDIDVRIANAADKHACFSDYIDRDWSEMSARQLARALSIHALNAVRLGRLLRDRRALAAPGPDPVPVDALIADLNDKLDHLVRHIDGCWPTPEAWEWGLFVTVYSLNAVRLATLMAHRCALRHDPYDDLKRAVDAARDLIGQEWDNDG